MGSALMLSLVLLACLTWRSPVLPGLCRRVLVGLPSPVPSLSIGPSLLRLWLAQQLPTGSMPPTWPLHRVAAFVTLMSPSPIWCIVSLFTTASDLLPSERHRALPFTLTPWRRSRLTCPAPPSRLRPGLTLPHSPGSAAGMSTCGPMAACSCPTTYFLLWRVLLSSVPLLGFVLVGPSRGPSFARGRLTVHTDSEVAVRAWHGFCHRGSVAPNVAAADLWVCGTWFACVIRWLCFVSPLDQGSCPSGPASYPG